MTGSPTKAGIRAPSEIETVAERVAIVDWLYLDQYDRHTPVDHLARVLHRNCLAFDKMRRRAAHSWGEVASSWIGVDVALLMKTWAEWRERNHA